MMQTFMPFAFVAAVEGVGLIDVAVTTLQFLVNDAFFDCARQPPVCCAGETASIILADMPSHTLSWNMIAMILIISGLENTRCSYVVLISWINRRDLRIYKGR